MWCNIEHVQKDTSLHVTHKASVWLPWINDYISKSNIRYQVVKQHPKSFVWLFSGWPIHADDSAIRNETISQLVKLSMVSASSQTSYVNNNMPAWCKCTINARDKNSSNDILALQFERISPHSVIKKYWSVNKISKYNFKWSTKKLDSKIHYKKCK